MNKHFSKILTKLIIALFLEVIVFNITSYRTLLGNYEKREFTNFENVKYDDDKVILKIDNLNINVATVKVDLKKCYNPLEYKVYFSDETSSNYRGLNSKQYIESHEKSKYIPVYLSGKVNGIIIALDKNIYEDKNINKITLNEKIPFEFNIIRFLSVLGILVAIYFLKNSEIFKEQYSIMNLKQELVLLGTVCVFCVVMFFINQNSIEPDEHKIYNEMFVNSVYNGHFYLDYEPSEAFLNLDNPYDDLERSTVERGKDYLWDTAYYNGKFYVYFGILPLLTIFLPFYVLTKQYLDMNLIVFGLSIVIFVLIKEILSKIMNRYFKNISFKFVLFSLIMLCSGTMIIYANGMSRFYEMSILAGLYCVLQGMYFILKSMETDEKKYKNIFLGSLFLSLSVACRPTDLFASLIIVPYLVKLLIDNIKIFKDNKMPLLKLILAVRHTIYYSWSNFNVV